MKANQDIRDYMADRGVTQRMLAEQMGTNLTAVNKKLSRELSQNDKEEIIRYIDACENDHLANCEDTPITEPEATKDEPAQEVTNSPKFQIGDRVKIPSKVEAIGIVADIWHSVAKSARMYAVEIEPDGHCGLFAEDQLEPAPLPIDYTFGAHIDGNVAVVTMMAKQGEKEWVYARGHAHILHDGAVGMAQAISFASKRMFESLDRKEDNQIYFKDSVNK